MTPEYPLKDHKVPLKKHLEYLKSLLVNIQYVPIVNLKWPISTHKVTPEYSQIDPRIPSNLSQEFPQSDIIVHTKWSPAEYLLSDPWLSQKGPEGTPKVTPG